MITAKMVSELRERTGCGMMDCKKALTQAEGDMEKAIEFLREKGLATAAKKAGRIAAEGIVFADVLEGVGVVLEVNSETDFVAKNAEFQGFVKNVANIVAKANPSDIDALYAATYEDSKSVRDSLNELIAKIGENMNVRRFARMEGVTQTYVHGGGKIGVMVGFKLSDDSASAGDAFKTYAKDIAMQIAAVTPLYVSEDQVDPKVVEKEREILRAQALNEGKPEKIVDKMVEGRIGKFYKEICLVDQQFVKNPDLSVKAYTNEVAKQLGITIEILSFVRFEKGEGLEKREDNFADEVAGMIK